MLNGVLLNKKLVKKIPHLMEPEGSLPWIPGVWYVELCRCVSGSRPFEGTCGLRLQGFEVHYSGDKNPLLVPLLN